MLTVILAQLRHRRGRVASTLAAIAIAVASFSLLTSAAQGSRLAVHATVTKNARPLYDILVRAGAGEGDAGALLDADAVTETQGGISLDKWHQILDIPGVAVAAPVADVGYVMQATRVDVDLSGLIDPTLDHQVLRVTPTFVSDRGTTRVTDGDLYLYATRNRLEYTPSPPWKVVDHWEVPSPEAPVGPTSFEVLPDGTRQKFCLWASRGTEGAAPLDPADRLDMHCWSSDPTSTGGEGGHPRVSLVLPVPLRLAAVDPAQEAALTGLDTAVVKGHYLHAPESGRIPVVAANRLTLDQTVDLEVQQLPAKVVDDVAASQYLESAVGRADGTPGTTVGTRSLDVASVYPKILDRLAEPDPVPEPPQQVGDIYIAPSNPSDDQELGAGKDLDAFWTVGPRATESGPPTGPWGTTSHNSVAGHPLPITLNDPSRQVQGYQQVFDGETFNPPARLSLDGIFDTDKVKTGPPLSRLPFDIHSTPSLEPGDDAAKAALGGKPLEPSTGFNGAVAQAPVLLTSLDALGALAGYTNQGSEPVAAATAAPISTVRVRVTGHIGLDDASLERVRAVADEISSRTGLHVDLLGGSSTAGHATTLPAGSYGRPALTVDAPWTKKGVAAAVVSAIDAKSLLLAILALVACALAVGNATSAAVRSRSTELGVLACLGWRPGRLFGTVMGESALVGLLAGVVGTVAALGAAPVLGVDLMPGYLALAVPAAMLLAVLAAIAPAVRATRANPAAATRPPVVLVARKRTPRTIVGMSTGNVARAPGRSLVAALSLALGVLSITVLIIISVSFRGTVSGTVLGDFVTVQVRSADYVAAALTVLLGAVTVADVLYLNIRERGAEFALLGATGWRDGPLARLAGYEAFLIGLLGSLVGAGGALLIAQHLAHPLPTQTYLIAGVCAGAGLLIALLAAAWPVRSLRRLPMAQLLAEE
ncbi:FtsX-like permease family protein [Cellulomonas sp. URHD0024]|uniref:FtsX-like permease family protein n=1 Tax=Cellulomonas sp. URHD0024 TaxID=1302620 RepID=UPI0003F9A32A|nr:ABC transporter permease [Cellulomonas sp. URHD0024]